jgi:hypothetical protein
MLKIKDDFEQYIERTSVTEAQSQASLEIFENDAEMMQE